MVEESGVEKNSAIPIRKRETRIFNSLRPLLQPPILNTTTEWRNYHTVKTTHPHTQEKKY